MNLVPRTAVAFAAAGVAGAASYGMTMELTDSTLLSPDQVNPRVERCATAANLGARALTAELPKECSDYADNVPYTEVIRVKYDPATNTLSQASDEKRYHFPPRQEFVAANSLSEEEDQRNRDVNQKMALLIGGLAFVGNGAAAFWALSGRRKKEPSVFGTAGVQR